jgi:glutamate dehydrogenase
VATTDWPAMAARARAAAAALERPARADEQEAAALLRWMADGNFTFLGYRESRVQRRDGRARLVPAPATGLGLLRAGHAAAPPPLPLTGALARESQSRAPLVISKGNDVSSVHRAATLDYVGVKIFDARGRIAGERRFVGLWTAAAYQLDPRQIPLLRRRVARVLDGCGADPAGHDGKAVLHALATYPRDELFQTSTEALTRNVRGIVALHGRARTRLFLRDDPFGRFVSCLLYLPRERYDTALRRRLEALLAGTLEATRVESRVQLDDGPFARLHLLVRTDPARPRRAGVARIERLLAAATRDWRDELRRSLLARHDEATALALLAAHASSFPAGYREEVPADEAVDDLALLLAQPDDPATPAVRLLTRAGDADRQLRLRILRRGTPLAVAALLPLLEHLGLRLLVEHPHALGGPHDGWWVQDFLLERVDAGRFAPAVDAPRTLEALRAVWRGDTDSDGYHRLVLAAGLDWRGVRVLRAYGRWLAQLGLPQGPELVQQTLVRHAAAARALLQLFAARHDPDLAAAARARRAARARAALERALRRVERQDEDRILRAFRDAVLATVRCNHFRRDAAGTPPACLALKIATREVGEAPAPRPRAEIFVHGVQVEGVHLRMGPVARGGLRWSERRDDFRTEVLGLMQAQNVKNAVIVPVGAKGGFVLRKPPAERGALERAGHACYEQFIDALLDVTDNLVRGRVVPPPGVVRHDGDDPYLVVAADKGTAGFSDHANALAARRGFWLGDAFASGGSAGYDHKRMAITARGAWESVRRHCRELGLDADRDALSVAGIGDMSGDVFGNGLLRSRHVRLVAAFDHRHIFIDPAPDPAQSHAERKRLYRLPGSSWDDYDRRVLSPGGGVFARSARTVPLSAAARRLLGIDASGAPPDDVIRAILRLPVDLLWNGGIGTYVKASDEPHAAAGDRGNDAVRVDGRELRCRMVAEGGNLGFTQRGRVEYAAHGGRINTDFIDNAAGVNCSDVEVNVKIALAAAVEHGRLSRAARDRLLARMTDEVATLVLCNNVLQTQAISLLAADAPARLDEHAGLIASLERAGTLERPLAGLPDDAGIAARRREGRGLTRPELAMLLSLGKIWLAGELLRTDVADDPWFERELARAFPAPLRRRCAGEIAAHRLRREIIVTAITNGIVNRMGPAFVPRLARQADTTPAGVVRAWACACELTAAGALWPLLDALDGRVPATRRHALFTAVSGALERLTAWLLARHGARTGIAGAVATHGPGLAAWLRHTATARTGAAAARRDARAAALAADGVPAPLARRVATLSEIDSGADCVELARRARTPVARVAATYADIGAHAGLDELRARIAALPAADRWQHDARRALADQAALLHRDITAAALRGRARAPAAGGALWRERHATGIAAIEQILAAQRGAPADFAAVAVALGAASRLAAV